MIYRSSITSFYSLSSSSPSSIRSFYRFFSSSSSSSSSFSRSSSSIINTTMSSTPPLSPPTKPIIPTLTSSSLITNAFANSFLNTPNHLFSSNHNPHTCSDCCSKSLSTLASASASAASASPSASASASASGNPPASSSSITGSDSPPQHSPRRSSPPRSMTKEEEQYANLDDILINNKEWVQTQLSSDPHYFKKLSKNKSPKYLYIGCADARVPANEIMGLPAGEVFVHRNVANLVVGTDMNLLSCLQFAIEHLKVDHIIICGHYDCAGVRASVNNRDFGNMENWLGHIRDVARLHHKELSAIKDEEARHRRLVELNVIEQCLNIFKINHTQRRRMESYSSGDLFTKPRVHGLVFSPAEGVLHKLPIDYKGIIQQFQGLYDLYPSVNGNH